MLGVSNKKARSRFYRPQHAYLGRLPAYRHRRGDLHFDVEGFLFDAKTETEKEDGLAKRIGYGGDSGDGWDCWIRALVAGVFIGLLSGPNHFGEQQRMIAMETNSLQEMVMAVVGLNTVATFGMAFAIGAYKGNLDQWRLGVQQKIDEHTAAIAAIHQQDVRQALVDAQINRQSGLIELLGKRTHDLRNVLTTARLVTDKIPMPGFDEPVTGQGD